MHRHTLHFCSMLLRVAIKFEFEGHWSNLGKMVANSHNMQALSTYTGGVVTCHSPIFMDPHAAQKPT